MKRRGYVELGEVDMPDGCARFAALLEPQYKTARWNWHRKPPSAQEICATIMRLVLDIEPKDGNISTGGLRIDIRDDRFILSVDPKLAPQPAPAE